MDKDFIICLEARFAMEDMTNIHIVAICLNPQFQNEEKDHGAQAVD